MPEAAQAPDQRRRDVDRAEHHDGRQHVEGHARPLGAVHLGDEVLAVLAQARAFGGDVERVEQLLHAAFSRNASDPTMRRAPVADGSPGLSGRQRSSSEQARQRLRCCVGSGVWREAKTSRSARWSLAVNARRSSSKETSTRRFVSA